MPNRSAMDLDNRTADDIQRERAKLRQEYGALFDALASAFFAADPIGINFEHNTDEYEPEVGTILPMLRACRTVVDVQRVIHEEFTRWFTESVAGPSEQYAEIAAATWALVQDHGLVSPRV